MFLCLLLDCQGNSRAACRSVHIPSVPPTIKHQHTCKRTHATSTDTLYGSVNQQHIQTQCPWMFYIYIYLYITWNSAGRNLFDFSVSDFRCLFDIFPALCLSQTLPWDVVSDDSGGCTGSEIRAAVITCSVSNRPEDGEVYPVPKHMHGKKF